MVFMVLVVHNFYGSGAPSGENTVYNAERELLRSAGHEILEYTRHSDEIRNRGKLGTVQGGIFTPWHPFVFRKIRRLVVQHRPQVMHIHNTFPLISPAAFHAARGTNTATVFTLHNYRIFCPAAIPLRNGKPCIECLEKRSALPGLRYGCYRDSRLATFPLFLMSTLHRRLKTWRRMVDAFIALTPFQRELMVAAGLPENRTFVKPQFYPNPPDPLHWDKRQNKITYIGRLTGEKGVQHLLRAYQKWKNPPPLEIVGDGSQRAELEKLATDSPNDGQIRFLGSLPFEKTQELLANSKLLVLPSICFEGFPMVIREAFALGVPVAASNIGPLPSLVKDGHCGLLFTPANSAALRAALERVWAKPNALSRMAQNARLEFENKYTADVNYNQLMEIYDAAIRHRQGRTT